MALQSGKGLKVCGGATDSRQTMQTGVATESASLMALHALSRQGGAGLAAGCLQYSSGCRLPAALDAVGRQCHRRHTGPPTDTSETPASLEHAGPPVAEHSVAHPHWSNTRVHP
jgi:hypothetical protein